MRIGYIIASNDVMVLGEPIGFMYREKPDNANDSGWRVFSGAETREYADEPKNFAMYNASSVVKMNPAIAELLGHEYPVAFKRDSRTGAFVEVESDA